MVCTKVCPLAMNGEVGDGIVLFLLPAQRSKSQGSTGALSAPFFEVLRALAKAAQAGLGRRRGGGGGGGFVQKCSAFSVRLHGVLDVFFETTLPTYAACFPAPLRCIVETRLGRLGRLCFRPVFTYLLSLFLTLSFRSGLNTANAIGNACTFEPRVFFCLQHTLLHVCHFCAVATFILDIAAGHFFFCLFSTPSQTEPIIAFGIDDSRVLCPFYVVSFLP